jgi:hypothetical protein
MEMDNQDFNVDDRDAPNVFPYKKCCECGERTSCGSYKEDDWYCEEHYIEEEDSSEEWFDLKYPNACCHRCNTKLTGATVVYCGDACETWYCADCHDEGTDDCQVCASMK